MTISTYAELQSAVQNWLDDTSVSGDRTQEFIFLAEASLKRRLKTMDLEKRATATADDEWLALPTDFGSLRGIHMDGSPDKPLEYKTPQYLRKWEDASASGTPTYYTITDGQFQFSPPPSSDQTIEIIYYSTLANLSTSETSNWLLTDNPDIYLQASMAQAEIYGWNDQRGVSWISLLDKSLEELSQFENKKRQGSGPLSMSSGIVE